MNQVVSQGKGVIERIHSDILIIRNELRQFMLEPYFGFDFLAKIGTVEVQARNSFKHEEKVMGEYHHLPWFHLAEHRDVMNLFAYLTKNPTKSTVSALLIKLSDHVDYHDDCFANHYERLSLKRV